MRSVLSPLNVVAKDLGGSPWLGEGGLPGHGYSRAFQECPLSCLAFCEGCLEIGLWNSHQIDEIRKWPLAVLRKQSTLMVLHLCDIDEA